MPSNKVSIVPVQLELTVICHHGFFAYGIEQTTAMTHTKALGFLLGGIVVLVAIVRDFSDLLNWALGTYKCSCLSSCKHLVLLRYVG